MATKLDLQKLKSTLDDEMKKRAKEDPNNVSVGQVIKEVPGAAVKVAKNIGNFFTQNTQAFGNTIGSTLALPEQQNMLAQEDAQNYQLSQQLIEAIKKNKAQGRDSTRLMEQYRQINGSLPKIEELNPVITKTNKQVLGEAAGTLLEATAGASAATKEAQSFQLAEKSIAPELIKSGTIAASRKAAAIQAAKSVAAGTAQGYAWDVSSNLRQNKDNKDVFKPGIGTAIGAAIPLVSGVIGLTRTEAHLQMDDLINKGYTKDQAQKIITDGGYTRLIQNPKLQELGDQVSLADQKLKDATTKSAYEKAKAAYDLAFKAYKDESQAGFVKLPGAGSGASLSEQADAMRKDQGLPPRPQHQIDVEAALNAGDTKKAQKIIDAIPEGDPYKKSMQDFMKIRSEIAPEDKVSSFYNVDKLNINDKAKTAIKNEIQNAGKELEATVGKPLTNKEVLDLADHSSKILDTTVTREQTAEKIASTLKLRQKIAQAASDGTVDKSFIDLWIKDKSVSADIARQLQARKIMADPKDTQAIDALLESIYKTNKNADEIAKAAEGVDFNNTDQVTKFYRQFVQPKATEWIDLLRYNSMLTSPNTHLINTSSNFQGTGILAPIEKTITGMVDATRAALTGQPRKYAVGEGAAYAKGYYSNIADATKRFVAVMKGDTVFNYNPDLPMTTQIPLTEKGTVGRAVESTLKYPIRLLEAADQFFSSLTEGGVQSSLDYRASQGIGSPDDALKEAAKRLFRGELHSSEQGHVLNAIDDVTNLLNRARHSDNPITSTLAKFTLPFLRTPMNILKQGIEYSPMGITTLVGASNKEEQVSKMIIGMMSAAGAATLLGQDRLTWAEPTNAKQRDAFRAAGRQPYSVKIGNHWISYSKLHPAVAFNLALVSAIDDSIKQKHLDDSQADTILQSFAKYGNFLADQSYLKNIGDFVAATKGSGGGWSKLVSNYPQQLIPFRALMSWVERLTDPVQRKADTSGNMLNDTMQQIMAQIPGLSQKVPVRTGPLGQPIPNDNRVLNSFSPNRVSNVNPSYEGLYQMDEMSRKINRVKQDIGGKLDKEIRKRMLQGK